MSGMAWQEGQASEGHYGALREQVMGRILWRAQIEAANGLKR